MYDMAFTYLLMKDFAKARECYVKTVKLSPRGFFTVLTALDTLNREAAEDLPDGTSAAYTSLEWIDDLGQKAKLIGSLFACPKDPILSDLHGFPKSFMILTPVVLVRPRQTI